MVPTEAANEALFVDLDGTLVASDLFHESLVLALRMEPWAIVGHLKAFLQGRARLKQSVAGKARPDTRLLPFRTEVLDLLRETRARSGRTILATACDRTIAIEVAGAVGLFDDVLASDGRTNLKGSAKLRAIEDYCQERGISDWGYAGDSRVDLAVWRHAARIYIAAPSDGLLRAVKRMGKPVTVLGRSRSSLDFALKALRPPHWLKNLLVLLPLLLAHRWTSLTGYLAGLLALASFSLSASGLYVLNDLLDIEADRQHPSKRRRPFASGDLPVAVAPVLILALMAAAWLPALALPKWFSAALAAYVALACLYSFSLKRVVIVDVLTLAALYTLRILAGGLATKTPASSWMMAFSMFLFLSLAYLKRYSELARLSQEGRDSVSGRNYVVGDLGLLRAMGPTSGYLAVLVFALYINSLEMRQFYAHSWALWLICPLLIYWITRIWLIAGRGELPDDPLLFAVRDPASLIAGASAVVLVAIASIPA
jgi:4-hydroxybenzoate polyprenyltransferase